MEGGRTERVGVREGRTEGGTDGRSQSRGQFRFCNSIPIPVISIPIQFRLRYKIPKAIQFPFQFR